MVESIGVGGGGGKVGMAGSWEGKSGIYTFIFSCNNIC